MNTVYQASAEVPPSSAAAGSASCSLCGFVVRGQAYLTQHMNKKKCLERQRKAKEKTVQLEVTGLSNESGSTSTSKSSKVLYFLF